jgi:NADPH:quinone reductase-like Zn-dependent oxidoreductase
MALLPGGGQAELVAVDEAHVLPVPDSVDWPQAGGFVEVFATAHDALFTQAELKIGERLLVNGAAGGVGVAGVQLGVVAGALVTASARHHHAELQALGAAVEPSGLYDVILELVGGDNLRTNPEQLAMKGRIAVIGTGAGATAEINFGRLMRNRGRIHGSMLRARSREEKEDVVRRLEGHAGHLLATGLVHVPVEQTFPLEQAQAAYERFAAGGKFGKIVICP